MKRLDKVSKNIIIAIGILLTGICFLRSLNSTCRITQGELVNYIPDLWLVNILICALTIGICFIFSRNCFHLSHRKDSLILTVLDITVGSFLIILLYRFPLEPVADQHYLLEVASDLIHQQYDLLAPGSYFSYHPHQAGLILIEYGFSLLFGEYPYFILQVCNVILFLLSVRLISKISFILWNNHALTFAIHLCTLFFLPFWCYIGFVYGTIPGLFFALLAFYFAYLSAGNDVFSLRYVILSVIFMGIAIIFKKNYLIMMIALVIFYLLYLLRQKRNFIKICLLFPVAVLIYYLVTSGPVWVLCQIAPITIGDGVPSSSYIAMGLQEEETTPGWFNGYNFQVYQRNGNDSQLAHQESMQFIHDRLLDFAKNKQRYAISFFAQKNASMWNDPTFGGYSFIRSTPTDYVLTNLQRNVLFTGNTLNQILEKIQDILMMLTYFGLLLYLLNRKQIKQSTDLLLLIVFIGGYLFHTFWEAKSQYTFPYFFLLIGYALAGYYHLITSFRDNKAITVSRMFMPILAGIIISLLPFGLVESFFRLPDQADWNHNLQGVVTARLYSGSYQLSSESEPDITREITFSWISPDQVQLQSTDEKSPSFDGIYYPSSLGPDRIIFYADEEKTAALSWNGTSLSEEELTWAPQQTWKMTYSQ